jgi:regulatory protein
MPAEPHPSDDAKRPPRKKSGPKPMTKRRLENIAKFHVERFATTASQLQRVLVRRSERAARAHGGERAEFTAWAEEIVTRMVRDGIVDDARYAADRTASLRRLDKSPGKIRNLLRAKGVDRKIIDEVLAETAVTITGEDAALEAAVAYARRRRLGPFGEQIEDADMKRKKATKDLSALARAGFTYDIAKRIVGAASIEDI